MMFPKFLTEFVVAIRDTAKKAFKAWRQSLQTKAVVSLGPIGQRFVGPLGATGAFLTTRAGVYVVVLAAAYFWHWSKVHEAAVVADRDARLEIARDQAKVKRDLEAKLRADAEKIAARLEADRAKDRQERADAQQRAAALERELEAARRSGKVAWSAKLVDELRR